MNKRIRDILPPVAPAAAGDAASGLARLNACLDDGGACVIWLHGPSRAGKTALFDEFAENVAGAKVIRIDCRTVEPTSSGFLAALSEQMGAGIDDVEQAAELLASEPGRVIFGFDNYEVFRLADAWLRREFIPALDASARVVLISREQPAVGWTSSMRWQEHFLAISLGAPPDQDPQELEHLIRTAVPDSQLRTALEAVAVARRITRPILAGLCPALAADNLYEQLARLPFIEQRRDGLAIEDPVRRHIAARLQAADIDRCRRYQRGAWKVLRQQLRESVTADLWRHTADAIYLMENPVIREAFFPSESASHSVEPAAAADRDEIMSITARHEPGAVDVMQLWWRNLPSAFHVIRDATGALAGYYCLARPVELDAAWLRDDPVARIWQQDLRAARRRADIAALFLRRWLSKDDGEWPCPVQAAAWVDIKRTYLELRPGLRRVYLALQDIAPYGAAASQLGFSVLGDLDATLGGTTYHTAMLDFGPGSVDGWLCRLLAEELGITDDQRLDPATRELRLNADRVVLTPLEFGVVQMLESRAGVAVSRAELLQQVWGRDYDGGSNVVDAVMRGLRRKCGADAAIFETVRGVGYRLKL